MSSVVIHRELTDAQKKQLQVLREQQNEPKEEVKLCDWCNLRPGTKRCTKCKAVCYCSAACQKQAWTDGHRKICGKATGAKPITYKPPEPVESLEELTLEENETGAPASTAVAKAGSTALANPVNYAGLSGGFLDDGMPKIPRAQRHPYDRAMEDIDRLNEAQCITEGSKRLPVLSALQDLLEDLLDPDLVSSSHKDAKVVEESQMDVLEKGCDVLKDVCGWRAQGQDGMNEELKCSNLLIQLSEHLSPLDPRGRAIMCQAYRAQVEVLCKIGGEAKFAAINVIKKSDLAAAPGRDLEALRKLPDMYMDAVKDKIDVDTGITEEQDKVAQLGIDAAKDVLQVAIAAEEMRAWDQIQVARFLFWVVGWRKLDAATAPEAHDAYVLCTEMQVGSQPGHAPFDMAEMIMGGLSNMGYNAAFDGLD